MKSAQECVRTLNQLFNHPVWAEKKRTKFSQNILYIVKKILWNKDSYNRTSAAQLGGSTDV